MSRVVQYRIADIWYLHSIDLYHVATYYMQLKYVMLCEVQIVAAMREVGIAC